MDTCYMFLDSLASVSYPNNTNVDFTVALPKTERFKGSWSIGLSSLTIQGRQTTQRELYIACDLVLESFVIKTYKRVLRRIILPKAGFNISFNPVQYFALDNTRLFDSIRITLLEAETLKSATIQPGQVTCVLHFTKA